MKSSSYQIDGRDNHILLTRDAEWQSKCFKVQTDVSNVQGVPKKTHFQNAVGATVHWLNHK